MSRYRKIEVRTWSDEKFGSLTPMPPSGQGLWFFLLTGPHTGPIPGLFRVGRAAMAEELNWDIEAFDKAFAEVSAQGMAKADFKAKLVWLPNAIKHNKPESPNVVRSWRVELDLLPECDLKREAIQAIRSHLQGIGEAYVSAFDEIHFSKKKVEQNPLPNACLKPSPKPSAKAMPNQEQEQEQEQNKVNTLVEQKPLDPVETIFGYWQQVMDSPKSVLDDKRKSLIVKALKIYSPADICKAIRGCSKTPHNMGKNDRNTVYNGLNLILRDAEHIDYFIKLDSANANAKPGKETIAEMNARVMAEFLGDAQADENTLEMET